jgi:hypothetical protein
MWRFLHRHDLGLIGALAAALCLAGLTLSARAIDAAAEQAAEEQLAKSGQADHAVIIREHAGWDRDCAAIAHPALYIDEPPRHGSVCVRAAEIRIQTLAAGTQGQCIGRLVRGVRLVYRPDAGFAGGDGLRYAVQYPSLRKTVAVSIAVTPQAPSAANAQASMGAAAHQPAGPVPDCAELLF